jgi:type IX secretion system PorP/SprF family membrane protein
MKKYIFLFVLLCTGGVSIAQQELQVSQYMFNGMLLNPAYAGTHDYFSASLLHRSQWVNLDGAPSTQVFAIDGPIANKRMGVGLVVTNDQIGISSQLDVAANFAYHLPLGPGDLSFGVKAGLAMYSADLGDVTIWDNQDAVYSPNNIQNEMVTKFGFGTYYHTEKFYAGISIPVIYSLDDNILPEISSQDTYFTQHYYLNVGGVIDLGPALAFKPSTLVKFLPGAPIELDLNANFLLYERLWLGLGYRTQDAMIGMIEYNISPQLRIGYAYDYTLTDIQDYSAGSHEIMLGFDFGKDLSIKTRSPRYF